MTDVETKNTNGRLRPRRKATTKNETPRNLRRSESKVGENANFDVSTSTSANISTLSSDSNPVMENTLVQSFLCLYCDRIFPGKKSLSKHVQRIHYKSIRKYQNIKCNYCNHVETDTTHIITHMLNTHSSQYFACSTCLQRFTSLQVLNDHYLSHCDGKGQNILPYRNKLRHKNNANSPNLNQKIDAYKKVDVVDEPFLPPHLNGLISCDIMKKDDIDFEESISMNLILPPCKNLCAGNLHDKSPVIVLDDIQWKQKHSNINVIQPGDRAEQILSRLGVVHRSRGTETSRYWYRHIEESNKFERCFDTNFYLKVANNVQDNLLKFLDGTLNPTVKEGEPIKTRKSKNNVAINTIEGFPTLLATGQFSRNTIDDILPRAIAPKQKWKWDNTDNDKQTATSDDLGFIKRDSHTNKCIVGLFSSLDIWTQLRMRNKHEEIFKGSVAIEKPSTSSKELKHIIESRELPNTSTQIVKFTSRQAYFTESLDFPKSLGLVPSAPECEIKPAVLSGEWARKRCYVCCACGEQSQDPKSLSIHHSTHHPHAQVNNYEIVGEELLNADILKHLYVPPAPSVKKRLPLRGSKTCTKCERHMMAEELHQHILECAGDTPVTRRKVRQRPFGVRRRRTRLPESAVHKQIRKRMRSRRTRPKKIMRSRPGIRTPVGDAETIKKMIADLPAKRHRVSANQGNISRTVNRREKQIQMRLKRRLSENDVIRNNLKSSESISAQRKITRSNLGPKDNKSKHLSATKVPKNLLSKGQVLKIKITRKNIGQKRKKHDLNVVENRDTTVASTSSNTVNRSSIFSDASGSNQSIITRSNSGGGGASNSRRSGPTNVRNSEMGRSNSQNSRPPVPLKHSIASLTATSYIDTYHTQPKVFIQPNVMFDKVPNNISTYNQPRLLTQDEAYAKKLDKPPLCAKSDDCNLKNKNNKPRKGLNDCIAMLKGKLGDNTAPVLEINTKLSDSVEVVSNTPLCNDELTIKNQSLNNVPHSNILKNATPVKTVELANLMTPLDLSGKSSHSLPKPQLNHVGPLPDVLMKPICLPPIQSEPLPLVTGLTKQMPVSTNIPPVQTNATAITKINSPISTGVSTEQLAVSTVTVIPPSRPTTSFIPTVVPALPTKKTSDVRRSSEKAPPKGSQIRATEKTLHQRPIFDPTLKIPQYKVRQNNSQDNEQKDMPTDSAVALLPKEIVDILGTMSVQHRNTLLNALPQVFAKTVKDLKLVVDSNIVKDSQTSPNKSEIATQTMNSLPEQEYPPEFINIDTNKYLIDPVTGTITERPEKESPCTQTSETKVSLKEQPRLDVIDLTSEEEEHEKKIIENTKGLFIIPATTKSPEIDPVITANQCPSSANSQPLVHLPPSLVKGKSTNEKTSSLRAVRIKSANEKQKLLSANVMTAANVSKILDKVESNNTSTDFQNPPSASILTLETTACGVNSGSMISPAIQQAEISSTQQTSVNAAKSVHAGLGTYQNTATTENITVLKEPVDKAKEEINETDIATLTKTKLSEPLHVKNAPELIGFFNKCGIVGIEDKVKENPFIPITEPMMVVSSPHIIAQNAAETTHPAEKACVHPNNDLRESPQPEESQCNHLSQHKAILNEETYVPKKEIVENKQTIDLKSNTISQNSPIVTNIEEDDDDPEDDVSLALMVKQKKSEIIEHTNKKKGRKPRTCTKRTNKENCHLSVPSEKMKNDEIPLSSTNSSVGLDNNTSTECENKLNNPISVIESEEPEVKEIFELTNNTESIVKLDKKSKKGRIKSQSRPLTKTDIEYKDDNQTHSSSPHSLRRSRRGKSELMNQLVPTMVDQTNDAIVPAVIALENKLPLTKKQLIFSKLLDEKKSQDLKLKDLANPKSVNVIDSDTFHGELILECESMHKAESAGRNMKENLNDIDSVTNNSSDSEKRINVSKKHKKTTMKLKLTNTNNTEKVVKEDENIAACIIPIIANSGNETTDICNNETTVMSVLDSHERYVTHKEIGIAYDKISHIDMNSKNKKEIDIEINIKPNNALVSEGDINLESDKKECSDINPKTKNRSLKTKKKKSHHAGSKNNAVSTVKHKESPVTSSTDGDELISLKQFSKIGNSLDVCSKDIEIENVCAIKEANYVDETATTAMRIIDKEQLVAENKPTMALLSRKKNTSLLVQSNSQITQNDVPTVNKLIEVTEVVDKSENKLVETIIDDNSECSELSPQIDSNKESVQKDSVVLRISDTLKEEKSKGGLKRKKVSYCSLKQSTSVCKSWKTDSVAHFDDTKKDTEYKSPTIQKSDSSYDAVKRTQDDNTYESDNSLECLALSKRIKTKGLNSTPSFNKKIKSKKASKNAPKIYNTETHDVQQVLKISDKDATSEEIDDDIKLKTPSKECPHAAVDNEDNRSDVTNEMVYATRRTRSKSVMFKTVTATSPQAFDILVCDSDELSNNTAINNEPKDISIDKDIDEQKLPISKLVIQTTKKGSKKCKVNNQKIKKNDQKCDLSTGNEVLEENVLTEPNICSSDATIIEANSVNTSLNLDECESDDSSKSDIPLNKYVKEIAKKKTEKQVALDTSKEQNIKLLSSRQIQSRRKTVAVCGNSEPSRKSATVEEQSRSEQFMESFGFFSERKPRKSNLLAAKKIFETFHLTSNDNEDVTYRDNDRVTKKNQAKETNMNLISEDANVTLPLAGDNLTLKLDNDTPPNKKKCIQDPKIKSKNTETYCDICKKQFRRPDNLTRHLFTLLHISNLSAIEMNLPPKTDNEPPNCLVVYRRHLENLKRLNELEGGNKLIELPSLSDILKMTNPEKYGTLAGHKVSGRDLSRDEALFYECCELLKESYKNNRSKCEPSTSGQQTHKSYLIMGPKINEVVDKPGEKDEDVDPVRAKEILESEEVRNLENDLISGLKRAQTGNIFNVQTIQENDPAAGPYDFTSDNESKVPDIKLSRTKSDKGLQNAPDTTDLHEAPTVTTTEENETIVKEDNLMRNSPIPSTSTAILDGVDLFEDKFDKIKRKCRSQAAAAKNTPTVMETSNRGKSRKKADKKTVRKKDSNKHQRAVLTKGALKGFDGIKVSIPTSDIKLPDSVPSVNEDSPKKKKKKSHSKKPLILHIDSDKTQTSILAVTPKNNVDVYEFMDEVEDTDTLEFRPTSLSERFKNTLKDYSESHGAPNEVKDAEDSRTSVSDGDDFVYMSDDYLGSANETETENSIMSCEMGNINKILNENGKIISFKRKDSLEKNAVMGKIFKNNAVRNERRNSSRECENETSEKTNLDQLFDSLLEKETLSVEAERVEAVWSEIECDRRECTPPMSAEQFFSDSEAGVARQRARRKCTVGKQNILAETWSSESEQDVNYGRRPNSVESVVPVVRKKKSKKISSVHPGSNSIRRNRHITFKDLNESTEERRGKRDKRSHSEVAYYCSSAEEEESHTLVEQHGWIVGDSHKKLVTMLAHAKGRKRDEKRNLVE